MLRCIIISLAVLLAAGGGTEAIDDMSMDAPATKEDASLPSKRGEASLPSKRGGLSLRSKRSVTEANRAEIIEAHNTFRKAENAANIMKLEWNSVLEATSQGWADKCKWYHGQPDSPASPFEYPGQNIYAKYPFDAKINYTDIIFKWFDEKKYYSYEDGKCSKVCGHYTQVVWHETTDIGCAYSHCDTVEGLSWTNVLMVVCNYGPGGNWIGEKPYDKGAPCEACPGHCEDGLCVD